jgi:hypothetical protein
MGEVPNTKPITIIYDEIARILKNEGIEFYGFSFHKIKHPIIKHSIKTISFNFVNPSTLSRDITSLRSVKPELLGELELNELLVEILKPLGRVSIKIKWTTNNNHYKGYVDIFSKRYLEKYLDYYKKALDKAILNGSHYASLTVIKIQNEIDRLIEEMSQNWFCNGCPTPTEFVLK